MNETPLRDALDCLPLPEPPADLRERCRATIPSRKPRRRWAWAVAAAAGLALALLPRTGGQRTPGVAWADVAASVQTIQTWHIRSRVRAFDATHASATWHEYEGWGTLRDGILDRSLSQQEATLTLPSDDYYTRNANAVRHYRIEGMWGVKRRSRDKQGMLARGQSLQNLKATGSATTTWNGANAIRFDFRAEPKALSWRGETFVPITEQYGVEERTEVFVDPSSRRILAMRRYVRWMRLPEKPEALVMEAKWDYPTRVDPIRFDPKRFCAGARVIHMNTP